MKEYTPKLFDVLKGYNGKQFTKDVVSGIIVAIIALPLSIALALASGVGPEQGIYTAIFAGFVIAYCVLLIPLIRESIKTRVVGSKMVCFGVFVYFIVHFILNVGGVSAIIPLTGVPLLLISSGGSSLMASMAGLGFAQSEFKRNRSTEDEDNSR